MSSTARNFDILATSLSVLHNYFNGSIKLFSDLTKFLDTIIFRYSAKPFHVEFIRHILLSLVYKNIYDLYLNFYDIVFVELDRKCYYNIFI